MNTIVELPVLEQIKYRLSNKGYSVNLGSGVLSVFKETRGVPVKEVKGILLISEKRLVTVSGRKSRFEYVVIEVR